MAAFSSAARPVGMTAVSTVVGLLSMAAVSLNPLRVFGLFGSAAIIFSTLFTFSLLPALLALMKPHIRWKGDPTIALGGRPATSALRLLTGRASPRRVAVCALLIAACAASRPRASASTIVGSGTCQLIATSCKATGSSTKRWRGRPRSN